MRRIPPRNLLTKDEYKDRARRGVARAAALNDGKSREERKDDWIKRIRAEREELALILEALK